MKTLPYILLIAIAAFGIGGTWWFMDNQSAMRLQALEGQRTDEIRQAALAYADLVKEKEALESTLRDQSAVIDSLTDDRNDLKDDLRKAEDKLEAYEERVGTALKTVDTLDKLSRIDPELLQKYSKIFFLNEHYAPPRTRALDKAFLYHENKAEFLHTQVIPFFEDMINDAKDDGVDLFVVSAFRSFETQASLKGNYTVQFGSGANAFSADQGYSEHQLGTTIDFTTTGLNGELTGFEKTKAYEWLSTNAHKYGFILSYPENNAYYIFEPWHWRFVGKDLARELHRKDTHFYDMDQRSIDKYLVSIFD